MRGGLAYAFIQYGASFDPSYANIQGSGDGFVYTFAAAPALTPGPGAIPNSAFKIGAGASPSQLLPPFGFNLEATSPLPMFTAFACPALAISTALEEKGEVVLMGEGASCGS